MPRPKPNPSSLLTSDAVNYLRALYLVADDQEACDAEAGALRGIFLQACGRYGVDSATAERFIEAST